MASQHTDPGAWEQHRELIRTLYIVQNRSQDEVLEVLAKPPYCLQATPSQFERILAQELQLTKNLKADDWLAIDYHRCKRKRQDGKETEVYVNSIPQNPAKLRRQANRYQKRRAIHRVESPRLPYAVELKTPPPRTAGPNLHHTQPFDSTSHLFPQDAGSPKSVVQPMIEADLLEIFSDQALNLTQYTTAPDHWDWDPTLTQPSITMGHSDWDMNLDQFTGALDLDCELNLAEMSQLSDSALDLAHPSNLTAIVEDPSIGFLDYRSILLHSLPWFCFEDQFSLQLAIFSRPPSSAMNFSLQPRRIVTAAMALRSVMGLASSQDIELQNAFFSSLVPERFPGAIVGKLVELNDPSLADLRATELSLCLLSNNHHPVYISREDCEDIERWLMDVPNHALQSLVQNNGPTRRAITNWLLKCALHYSRRLFNRLLEVGLDKAYLTGAQGGRLLCVAVEISPVEIGLEILNESPDLGTRLYGKTALHLAAGRPAACALLKALLAHGAEIDAINEDEETPLKIAVGSGNAKGMTILLDYGADTCSLSDLLSSQYFVPEFEICDALCHRFPGKWPQITTCSLVFAAVYGFEEFQKKADQFRKLEKDMKHILERAFCHAMEKFYNHTPDPNSYLRYFEKLHGIDDNYPSFTPSRIIDVFLRYGVDPNARTVSDMTPPLASVINFGTEDDAGVLLNYGAVTDRPGIMQAVFEKADVAKNWSAVRKMLLGRGIGFNINNMNKQLESGRYPLQSVCNTHKGDSDLEVVKYLIQCGAPVNGEESRENNFTALHFAVEHGRLSIVRYLVDNGAKLTGWRKQPISTLFELCVQKCAPHHCTGIGKDESYLSEEHRRESIFKLLLEKGAEVNDPIKSRKRRFGASLAWVILNFPYSNFVYTVIKAGACIEFRAIDPWRHVNGEPNVNAIGSTPLQRACTAQPLGGVNIQLVKHLLDNGADINAPPAETFGKTALQEACTGRALYGENSFELINLLLGQGADVNASPAAIDGRTALQDVCDQPKANFTLIYLLLEKGADINAPAASVRGVTALQGAVIRGNLQLVLFLLERGAKVDAPGAIIQGRTALEAAAEHGRLDIAQILLNAHVAAGAEPELQNPIMLAKEEGHLGVVELLENWTSGWTT